MALHKLVNGEKVNLTPEEEAKTRSEWAENKIKHEEQKVALAEKKAKKAVAMEKIYANAGLTVEEKDLLKGNL